MPKHVSRCVRCAQIILGSDVLSNAMFVFTRVPPNIPISACAASLDPGVSFFSKVSYCKVRYCTILIAESFSMNYTFPLISIFRRSNSWELISKHKQVLSRHTNVRAVLPDAVSLQNEACY